MPAPARKFLPKTRSGAALIGPRRFEKPGVDLPCSDRVRLKSAKKRRDQHYANKNNKRPRRHTQIGRPYITLHSEPLYIRRYTFGLTLSLRRGALGYAFLIFGASPYCTAICDAKGLPQGAFHTDVALLRNERQSSPPLTDRSECPSRPLGPTEWRNSCCYRPTSPSSK